MLIHSFCLFSGTSLYAIAILAYYIAVLSHTISSGVFALYTKHSPQQPNKVRAKRNDNPTTIHTKRVFSSFTPTYKHNLTLANSLFSSSIVIWVENFPFAFSICLRVNCNTKCMWWPMCTMCFLRFDCCGTAALSKWIHQFNRISCTEMHSFAENNTRNYICVLGIVRRAFKVESHFHLLDWGVCVCACVDFSSTILSLSEYDFGVYLLVLTQIHSHKKTADPVGYMLVSVWACGKSNNSNMENWKREWLYMLIWYYCCCPHIALFCIILEFIFTITTGKNKRDISLNILHILCVMFFALH